VVDYFGTKAVYVLRGSTAKLCEISAGATIDRRTEIKTGIASGEKIIIQGQQFVSDGAPVRVIGGGV
jgi:hypothetical protein